LTVSQDFEGKFEIVTPTDTLFSAQWHFSLIGDITSIWDEFTGAGVSVGVYDGAVEATHHDLNDNYDATLEVTDCGGSTLVPGLIATESNGTRVVSFAHGTSAMQLKATSTRSPPRAGR
jgi:hypothetical protein